MLSSCFGQRHVKSGSQEISMCSSNRAKIVDVLLLGAGWTSTFLIPLLHEKKLTYASTTRDGRDGTLKFQFDPEASSPSEDFKSLPDAEIIVIIFPIYQSGGSKKLVDWYRASHRNSDNQNIRWLQLGSTGIWDGGPTLAEDVKKPASAYIDRHTPFNPSNARAQAEEELLALHSSGKSGNFVAILNLCGLYGGSRSIRRYVGRIAGSKDLLRAKGAIHMIHGVDVARAILATGQGQESIYGQRWLLTDLRVYDWYDLASKWGTAGEEGRGKPAEGPQAQWVLELMAEQGIRSLPRTVEEMGKGLDSREFWQTAKINPIMGGQLD